MNSHLKILLNNERYIQSINLLTNNISYIITGIALAVAIIFAIVIIAVKCKKNSLLKNSKEDVEEPYIEEPLVEDKEIFKGLDKKTGLAIVARYKYSFKAKLSQTSEDNKRYYSALKNEILSFQDTKSRISWDYDSITVGRKKVAKFTIRGKTLSLYLALNPKDFTESKYKINHATTLKYAEVPCQYKIINDRRLEYAIELIDLLAENLDLTKLETEYIDYMPKYEDTKELIKKGHIEELISKEDYEEYLKRKQLDKTET